MQIIISPAKKMQVDTDSLGAGKEPLFLSETGKLLSRLREFNRGELRELFQANEKITEENYQRFASMDLTARGTPAVLSYRGLQYQYMAPQVFTDKQWEYVKGHLWILSGFYGILRPDHAVMPYRLEMQAKLSLGDAEDLYKFWGGKLYRELIREDHVVLNLASKEYSKAIEPYLEPEIRYITCIFGSLQDGQDGKGRDGPVDFREADRRTGGYPCIWGAGICLLSGTVNKERIRVFKREPNTR